MNKPLKKEEELIAISQIPENWFQVTGERDVSRKNDKAWNIQTKRFEQMDSIAVDEWQGYFYCLIREKK